METSQPNEVLGRRGVAASDASPGRPLCIGKVTLEMKQKDGERVLFFLVKWCLKIIREITFLLHCRYFINMCWMKLWDTI